MMIKKKLSFTEHSGCTRRYGKCYSPLFPFRLKTILGHEFCYIRFIDVETEVCAVKQFGPVAQLVPSRARQTHEPK